ncbi:hypothetical protein MKEN_01255700 [Mycena kentingensis (nom. inval.)]|nr:hypothetical protein MKEN_01255700 [Mycena kentingensis (nom. inval.)]
MAPFTPHDEPTSAPDGRVQPDGYAFVRELGWRFGLKTCHQVTDTSSRANLHLEAMEDTGPLIRIGADELNCLIYSFLLDSGFKHTAFSLCMEANLAKSPNYTKHIPRGELVDLLSKALLYREVEAHWKSDNLARNCKQSFTLLDPHVCSLEPPRKGYLAPLHSMRGLIANGVNGVGTDGKRKASPLARGEGPAEKRARRDGDIAPRKLRHHFAPADSETDPRAILVLPGHQTQVFTCLFNPAQPSILVSGRVDFLCVCLKLPADPVQVEHFHNPSAEITDITTLHWNHDGSLVAVGGFDFVLRILTSSGDLYFSHTQHLGPIFGVQFSGNGEWLLSASLDGSVCLWDVAKRELHTQYRLHTNSCLNVEWLSDTRFASSAADSKIEVMEIGRLDSVCTLRGHTDEIHVIRTNPARTRLASASDDHTARIWNIENMGADSVVLYGHTARLSQVQWCADLSVGPHEVVATSSEDGTVRLWDSLTGACLHIFNDHKGKVFCLRFSPDGRWLASGSADGWLHVYDVKSRTMRWSWFGDYNAPGVFDIDWQQGPDLDRIAVALEARSVVVIDALKVPALQSKI